MFPTVDSLTGMLLVFLSSGSLCRYLAYLFLSFLVTYFLPDTSVLCYYLLLLLFCTFFSFPLPLRFGSAFLGVLYDDAGVIRGGQGARGWLRLPG